MASATSSPESFAALLQLAAGLAERATRAARARELANALGARDLLIFVRDTEVNSLLTAPGFRATLPDAKAWRSFLRECAEKGELRSNLSFFDGEPATAVFGVAPTQDAAMVFIGVENLATDVTFIRDLLPLFTAMFRGEHSAVVSTANEKLAAESSARATAIADVLRRSRMQLEEALRAAENARSEAEAANELLRNLAEELEAQADDLHHVNNQLDAAREMAVSANRAKSEFLATMSHELRTPLNAIGGYAQLLSMGIHGPVTDQQKDTLDRIERSERHLLGLINDILNLARIESGKLQYNIQPVIIADVLHDLSPMIEPQLASKNIRYDMRITDQSLVANADPDKLQQILLNLLSNAVKFTESGGHVSVDAEASPGGTGDIIIRITDTGCGIPNDKLELIFDPFMQVDRSHSRLVQGTGLGLSISRDLARGMGGDIRVESRMGAGSAFQLCLSRAKPGVARPPTGAPER